jgi:hypothetical protein
VTGSVRALVVVEGDGEALPDAPTDVMVLGLGLGETLAVAPVDVVTLGLDDGLWWPVEGDGDGEHP